MKEKILADKLAPKNRKYFYTEFYKLGIGVLFLILVMLYTLVDKSGMPQITFLTFVAVVGAYMAINIGANDVANNMGPAVGSKALTLVGAIIIAAIFEASGALIAGGDVVSTIKKGIIDPNMIADTDVFIWVMFSALLGGALWLNIATAFGAPVSTTHSIVGGIMGAGIISTGWELINWSTMTKIAASWVISPVLGGLIAALFLYIIQDRIFHKEDTLESAKKAVPFLIAAMSFAFITYLALKGIKKIVKLDITTALAVGSLFAIATYLVIKPLIVKASAQLSNAKSDINKLFTVPLIFAAALLSFAHGANDVANAIGPVAAIYEAVQSGSIVEKAAIPPWIMIIGALGIAVGLATYGPKLIKTVGSEITDLDQARAWSVAMSSAIVVIIASWLGLPVSSTHIAIGGVFGVGYLRYYLYHKYESEIEGVKAHHVKSINKKLVKWNQKLLDEEDENEKTQFLNRIAAKREELKGIKTGGEIEFTKKEIKKLVKIEKKQYVRGKMLIKIVTAWLVTVPMSALIAATLYFCIRLFY
ncbi:inorganic phosphate transporter [Candidatus Parabeggiatoa sp. HSG14]|uniref:inorganic phosphate transporter n=1 Tax=Candidatus Parabeggiatoa sp. HSG14 TaxID=3055593 RepID=UPI0025A91BC2|nr:inorganic phosphate transporter [Thiotrichales bacterium HSG14]